MFIAFMNLHVAKYLDILLIKLPRMSVVLILQISQSEHCI